MANHRSRSPLKERERTTSPQRREHVDYGEDAEKHVQHIARTKKLTTFAGETRVSRRWSWVLRTLVHRRSNRGHGCPVEVLDTVTYGVDDAPEAVFYTRKGAVVRDIIGEDDGCISLAKAMKHLKLPKRYLGIQRTLDVINGAVAFSSTGEPNVVKSIDITKIGVGQGAPPQGTEALVVLVPTKSVCAELLLGIQHTYTLEPGSAKPIHLSYRLAMVKGESRRVQCKSSVKNRQLARACSDVVEWIEACVGGRVLRLVLEFVEDALGKLWLVRSSECATTEAVQLYHRRQHSPSPAQSKVARLQTAKGVADELSLLRYGHGVGQSTPHSTEPSVAGELASILGEELGSLGSSQRPYSAITSAEVRSKGSHANTREERKIERNSIDKRSQASRPKTTVNNTLSRAATRSNEEEGNKLMFQGFAAPKEKDPRSVGRTAAAGRALGSSQLGALCHGDFCEVILLDKVEQQANFEREETGNTYLSPKSSVAQTGPGTVGEGSDEGSFRKRLLRLDEATLEDHGILSEKCSSGNVAAKMTSASRLKGGRWRVRARERGCGENGDQRGDQDSKTEWNEIPFSWVVRGRQERHLIDQQLRRYRRGDKEPFVTHLSSLAESSVSLGAVFPATYYKSVRVCRNCYRVYTMIDAARTRSVNRLDARAASAITDTSSTEDIREQPSAKRARVVEGTNPVHYTSATGDAKRGGGSLVNPVDESNLSMETLALRRAQVAIDGLTRGDICELRSFSKPPAAVNMVIAALMVVLTGDGEPSSSGWFAAKRFMTDIDNLFTGISELNLDSLKASQIRQLEDYARNPAFRPEIIASVSLPASRLCAWVLGVLEAQRWRTGRGHPRISLLGKCPGRSEVGGTHPVDSPCASATASESLSISSPLLRAVTSQTEYRPLLHACGPSGQTRSSTISRDASALGPAVFPFPPSTTDTSKARKRRRHRPWEDQSAKKYPSMYSERFYEPKPPLLPHAWVPSGAGTISLPPAKIGSPSRASTASPVGFLAQTAAEVRNTAVGEGQGQGKRMTRATRAAARGQQSRTADRLANATAAPPDPTGFERSEFCCADGVTLIPFAVAGKAETALLSSSTSSDEKTCGENGRHADGIHQIHKSSPRFQALSFVVVHDFFDTLEKTFLLFKPLLLRHPGCQVLCFNYPGQAGTRLPPDKERLLNNDWMAERIDELMQHVDNMGLMPLSAQPFHLLGIGNGGSIAASFTCHLNARPMWKPTLRTLTCINGFATVDAQLAAVLHSVQRAFRCFPPERPDLPITLWSRFIFSDTYLERVGSDLALNIYSAVANPLAVEGMLHIIRSTLNSRDLRKDLSSIPLPLVLIQSTDNLLVNAANVDAFLEGRHPRHVWSHQLQDRPSLDPSAVVPLSASTAKHNSSDETAGDASETKKARSPDGNPNGARQTPVNMAGCNQLGWSCIGSAGEHALFESISAGREGAFITWVKGGHEIRQECKRVVTDLLELLIAPRGQMEAFFRRGPQPQETPVGKDKRVGIAAAKLGSAGQKSRVEPSTNDPKSTTRDACTNLDLAQTGVTWEDSLESVHGHGPAVDDEGDMKCRVGDSLSHTRENGAEGATKVRVDGGTSHQMASGAPKYGYASLRKIHNRDPFPQLPSRPGHVMLLPTSSKQKSTRTRGRSGARTAPADGLTIASERFRRGGGPSLSPSRSPNGFTSHRSHSRSPSSRRGELPPTEAGTEAGEESRSGEKDCTDCKVVPLERTIADFEEALRVHRKSRGQRAGLDTHSPLDRTASQNCGPSSSIETKTDNKIIPGEMMNDEDVQTNSAQKVEKLPNLCWDDDDKDTNKPKTATPSTPFQGLRDNFMRHGMMHESVMKPDLPRNKHGTRLSPSQSPVAHSSTNVNDGKTVNGGVKFSASQSKNEGDASVGEDIATAPKVVAITGTGAPLETEFTTAEHPEVGRAGPPSDASSAGLPMDTCTSIAGTIAPVTSEAMETPDMVSTVVQREARDWMKGTVTGRTPNPLTIAEAEAEISEKVIRLEARQKALERAKREGFETEITRRFGEEQAIRAATFAGEDRRLLVKEKQRLEEVRENADLGRLQRGAEFEEIDEALVAEGAITPMGAIQYSAPSGRSAHHRVVVRGMRPQRYGEAEELPEGVKRAVEHIPADQVLDRLETLAARARTTGSGAKLEDFERAEQQQRARQIARLEILNGHTEGERSMIALDMALRLQQFARSALAKRKVARMRVMSSNFQAKTGSAIVIQALVRGHLNRIQARRRRQQVLDEAVLGGRATMIQRVYRGRLGRWLYIQRLRHARSGVIQRVARGFLARRMMKHKRARLARLAARASSAAKIQSAWRGKVARDAYLRIRSSWLASREIQRVYRGHLRRRTAMRRRDWQAAAPGAERLKLGMRIIEDTKVAFEKQQEEIAALDRAQEKAEARVSFIHHQLTTSEAELSILEGEMAQVDHLERDLVQLTHERDLISKGIMGATGLPRTGKEIHEDGPEGNGSEYKDRGGGGFGAVSSRKAEAYNLEMQVQLKRAEREQRRQQLSAEFASTFADVADKKRQLDRLSLALADIEATRQRKSREFGHMQRNLMELLAEQKRELDQVREKGVQLETAAATSAAAAAATAQRARDHEAKAAAMYGQTEELMKFQFMSMSLSYFSSLNMMKQMREINADTTTAAIVGSADAAAAAAASAAAASIPSLKHTEHLGGDAVSQALTMRKKLLESSRREVEEVDENQRHPFPSEIALWSVDDVCRWLDTLQLGEYKRAFKDGKVDGSFLAELRESDLVEYIGMKHKLHLRKLLLARQKLLPLSQEEVSKANAVRREETATAAREGIPDVDNALSQARHGKKKRLEETLNLGFDIESEDENGNTLLLVAVQQLQTPVVEFLLQRGANVNHGNAAGNTPLHFAMLYDTSGQMGEFLITNGADDSIENKRGCSPYDGI